ncbi:hypothetical protein I4F81_005030 [Pyropia yezoensis]|uniref:Uncharacterized protein n=1 Tax=Pyropia yezoensis TaxID=2788 RepID=A0ACC3BY96_PYRYE|nr:hypothetical protein I4F81_005030 [Neopyropia yezoensis]
MVAAAAAATPHPSAAVPNADILAASFTPFYALVRAELDLDDTVLFTHLEGQDAPLPSALSAAGREHLRGGNAAARKRPPSAGSMGELAAAVDDVVPPLLSYYTARARRPQLPDGAALDATLAGLTAAAAAAAGAPHDAVPTTDGAVAAEGAALVAATTLAAADATAWVDAHHPVHDELLVA